MRIPWPEAPPPLPVKPKATAPRRDPFVEELDSIIQAGKRRRREQAEHDKSWDQQHVSIGPTETPPRRSRKRTSKPTSTGPGVFGIIASLFGFIAVLGCSGLIVVAFFAMPRTTVITSSGFEAQATGNKRIEKQHATGHAQGLMNYLTGSEFWIGSVTVPAGVNPALSDVRSHFGTFSQSTRLVSRNGLSGFHCDQVQTEQLGIASAVEADMEVFVVSGKVMYTAYFPGSRKAAAFGKGRNLGPREVGWDQPEKFFESFRQSN